MRRQKSANTKHHNRKPDKPKSLGDRYFELLKLREAVSKIQSNLELSAHAKRAIAKEDRAPPVSLDPSICLRLLWR